MGLCKCPKRKVTNQFCYEHRVNVCEHCVVQNHPKCVVQSYLLWLQDSDYSPQCPLCNKPLAEDECLRLACYHIFHWDCLDIFVRELPDTTAPAGYRCPTCKESILPQPNLVSPVADALREKLASVNWGRIGLGLPLTTEEATKPKKNITKPLPLENGIKNNLNSAGNTDDIVVVHMEDNMHLRPENSAQVPRRNPHSAPGEKAKLLDDDESKYRRRYGFLRFSLWFKFLQNQLNITKGGPKGICKVILLAVIVFCIICAVLSYLGNAVTSDDPSFDVRNDPNVRFN